MSADASTTQHHSTRETLQSLIVAFVMAMVFRGFVLEGFEIPTGSMAPTLLGRHVRLDSWATDYSFPADSAPILDPSRMRVDPRTQRQVPDLPPGFIDPMISQSERLPWGPTAAGALQERLGDRVLVLKYLWPLTAPKRWDVVVFRNPTDPVGDSQYYIKRLVGMPNESLALLDGDVFAGSDQSDLQIQRKPVHVQRAVWQPVYNSDYQPVDIKQYDSVARRPWAGAPWRGAGWLMRGEREWRWESAAAASLQWDNTVLPIDDYTAYNMFRMRRGDGGADGFPVSDIRLSASIAADDPQALATALRLTARSHVFMWELGAGQVRLSVRHAEGGASVAEVVVSAALPGRSPAVVEFWHVDQRMSLWFEGREVAALEYDFGGPLGRLKASHFGRTLEQYLQSPLSQKPTPPALEWEFSGTPVALRRVQLDRDLYYRPAFLNPADQFSTNGEPITGLAFGIDVRNPPRLGERDYLMLGDNSAASRDGRLWGRPHTLVNEHLDYDTPFLVPEQMLIGKAWSVYFPAPQPPWPGGMNVVPDFGQVRFIR